MTTTQNAFDTQPRLIGKTLVLRPLLPQDFGDLYAAASDPETWAGHPAKDRYKLDVFQGYFDYLVNNATLAITERETGKIIGCSRYYKAPDQPNDISIGFTFLNHAHWGGVTNFELKSLMLDHAFKTFQTVWFHIGPTNIRSQKATAKLGAIHVYDATLDLSGTPTEWACFSLSQQDWQKARDRKRS